MNIPNTLSEYVLIPNTLSEYTTRLVYQNHRGFFNIYFLGMMMNAAEQAEEFAIAIWHKLQSWKVIHFSHLPQWLQDNDFLHFGHRPPLPTIECFKSIIRIHTETGNIWTHLLGM